jgi:hypothetical protein
MSLTAAPCRPPRTRKAANSDGVLAPTLVYVTQQLV